MEKDDVQLIQDILSGDDEAFGILVHKYQKSVHALAWRKIGDFHYAEELTQDTFLQAHKKLSTLKDRSQFAGWLYVITNRLCIDWIRKRKPAMQSLGDTTIKTIDKLTYESYMLEQRETEAAENRNEMVKALLQKLPESERTVVTLYYLGEMTAKEIGKFLGVSVNTITSRLKRARERLRGSEELLIKDTLGGLQLPTNLFESIMKQISDLSPVPSPSGKPILPWMAFSAATVMVILLLGISDQFLGRYQKPYSLDAQSEPTIEIVEAPAIIDADIKPDKRKQFGPIATLGKSNSVGSQVLEKPTSTNTTDEIPMNLAPEGAPKVTRFTLSNGIKVVNLHVENSKDVGIFSYLPLGFVSDGKAKSQWSNLIMHLLVRSSGPIDFKTSNAETMGDNMRLDFMGNTETWKQGLELHANWLSGLPFSAESLAETRLNALSQIDYVEKNLATHKYADAAWNQVFRHGLTDIPIRGNIQSAHLSELQDYRDQYLVQAERVLLCVIGGVNPNILKETMEKQLGGINLSDERLRRPSISSEIAKDQNATWDINVTHYMEAYAIPPPEDEDYPSLYITSVLLQLACMQDTELKEITGHLICSVNLTTPEQTYFYISASLKPEIDIEIIKKQIHRRITYLKQSVNNSHVSTIAKSISKELSAPPDIKELLQHNTFNVSENMALLQLGVSWGMLEYRYGETMSQLAKAIGDVSAADVASAINQHLTEENRITLVLTPRLPE